MADDQNVDSVTSGLIRFNAAGRPARRLFCLPFAGGGPAKYRLWPKNLPDDIEVIAVQLPGRDPSTRQPAPDSIDELVAASVAAIRAMQLESPLPFAIFGHSMGALIGYELTVEFERFGEFGPDCLFVSSRRAPDELHTGPMIHALDDEDFLDQMQRLYGGVPDVIRNEPELLAMLLPALRADVRSFETYVPSSADLVRCPLHVYGGDLDTRPSPAALAGWQRVAAHPVSIRTFAGDHFYLDTSRTALISDIATRWAEQQQAVRRT